MSGFEQPSASVTINIRGINLSSGAKSTSQTVNFCLSRLIMWWVNQMGKLCMGQLM